jgi:hypothetical protein
LFEAVEQAVNVQPVKDHAGTLTHGHQLRPPHFVKSAALHAHVFHGFLVGEAAFEYVHTEHSSRRMLVYCACITPSWLAMVVSLTPKARFKVAFFKGVNMKFIPTTRRLNGLFLPCYTRLQGRNRVTRLISMRGTTKGQARSIAMAVVKKISAHLRSPGTRSTAGCQCRSAD